MLGCSDRSDLQAATGDSLLQGRLLLTGSSTVAPLATEIAKRFEAMHPETRVDVQTGGSSKGIADVAAGRADIGMASRSLKPEDPGGLRAHIIARDGVCVVVHADNALADLTSQQVRDIYTGRQTHWQQASGLDQPIVVISKAEGRATLEVFLAYLGLPADAIRASVVIGDNEQAILTVAQTPTAIAFVSVGSAEYARDHGQPIRLPSLDEVPASTVAVGGGRFPISRPLNLVTREEPSELAKTFIAYAGSAAVEDLVASLHYVPTSN